MKKLLGILLALMLTATCFGAVAEKNESTLAAMMTGDLAPKESEWDGEYAGHWEAVGMGLEGLEPTVEYMSMPTSVLAKLDLNADGTFALTLMGNTENGAWETTETGLQLTIEGKDAQLAELKNGQLIYNVDGILGYFAKGTVELVSKVPAESAWNGEIAGKWVCIGVDAGMGYLADNLAGMPAGMLLSFELSADGAMTMTSSLSEAKVQGTWEGTADALKLDANGQIVNTSIVNGQMVFPMSETSMLVLAQQ